MLYAVEIFCALLRTDGGKGRERNTGIYGECFFRTAIIKTHSVHEPRACWEQGPCTECDLQTV